MTAFEASLRICGLGQFEAAEFFDTPPGTVAEWCTGARPVPPAAWAMLSQLFRSIDEAASEAAEILMDQDVDPLLSQGGIRVDTTEDPMPRGATEQAGAMAILLALSARAEEADADITLG